MGNTASDRAREPAKGCTAQLEETLKRPGRDWQPEEYETATRFLILNSGDLLATAISVVRKYPGSRIDAQEGVGQYWTKITKNLDNYEPDRCTQENQHRCNGFLAFVRTGVRSATRDMLKSENRLDRRNDEIESADSAAKVGAVPDYDSAIDAHRIIEHWKASLSETKRLIVEMKIDRYPDADIAMAVGLSQGAVRVTWYRMCGEFRTKYWKLWAATRLRQTTRRQS